MKTSIQLILFLCVSSLGYGQVFELNRDLKDGNFNYQGIVESGAKSADDLMKKAGSWLEKAEFKQELDTEDAEAHENIYDLIFSVIGQKSELGDAYNYRFAAKLKLEFKDGKVRYTFYDFVKKSSPGEPGMSMEAHVANYEPKISSKRSREKADKRLDEIEISIHEGVIQIIENLEQTFTEKKSDDW